MAQKKKLVTDLDEALKILAGEIQADRAAITSFRFETPVKEKEIAQVEKKLKIKLPADYREFISTRGLFVAFQGDKRDLYRMLHPKESLARIENEIASFDPDLYDDPSDLKHAKREHEVRKRLYPLQYMSHYVGDFYSYLLKPRGSPILNIYHDDFELSDWLLARKPKFAKGAFPATFEEHMIRIVAQCLEGEYSSLKAR